ncbi:hypothetical protein GGS21DRAFT_489558 [Xylaria nigripes]|nr:hypothetical protein GGS21DRAFT_489558 [Xylaria nigripes]
MEAITPSRLPDGGTTPSSPTSIIATPTGPRIVPYIMSSPLARTSLFDPFVKKRRIGAKTAPTGLPTVIESSECSPLASTPISQCELAQNLLAVLESHKAEQQARQDVLTTAATALDRAFAKLQSPSHRKWADKVTQAVGEVLLHFANSPETPILGKNLHPPTAPPTTPTAPATAPPAGRTSASTTVTSVFTNTANSNTTGSALPEAKQHSYTVQKPSYSQVAAAAPLTTPPNSDNQWTEVTNSKKRRSAGGQPANISNKNFSQPSSGQKDKRLFLRVPEGHPWHDFRPERVRILLATATGITLAEIPKAQKTKTGWALTAKDEGTRARLLQPWPFLAKEKFSVQ